MRNVFSGCFYLNSRLEIFFILATGYHNDVNYKKMHKYGLCDFPWPDSMTRIVNQACDIGRAHAAAKSRSSTTQFCIIVCLIYIFINK